jgi:hypothetical protein
MPHLGRLHTQSRDANLERADLVITLRNCLSWDARRISEGCQLVLHFPYWIR